MHNNWYSARTIDILIIRYNLHILDIILVPITQFIYFDHSSVIICNK